jgi:hypothetical protein
VSWGLVYEEIYEYPTVYTDNICMFIYPKPRGGVGSKRYGIDFSFMRRKKEKICPAIIEHCPGPLADK